MCRRRKTIGSFIMTVIAVTCLFFAFAPTRSNAAVELLNKKIGPNVTAILTSDGTLDVYGTGSISDVESVSKQWGDYINKIEYISIGEGITSIGTLAFCGCEQVKVVSLPSTLTRIGDRAFCLCYELEKVNLPNSLKIIDKSAFLSCKKLTSISFPENLESIEQAAFGYTGLKSVVIPEKVKKVGDNAFISCQLRSFTVKGKNTSIGYVAAGFIFDGEMSENRAIDDITITGPVNSDAERYAEQHGFDFVCIETIPIPKISSLTIEKNGIRVKWPRVSVAKGYHLLRKTGSGAYVTVKTITDNSQSTISCLDTSLSSGKTYSYAVVAYRGINNSGYTGKSILYLSKPTTNTANEVSGVRVKWNKISGAKGYYILRKTGSGSYSKIATISKATTTNYLDKKVSSGKTYTYAVKAYSGSWQSGYNEKNQLRLSAPSIKLSRTSRQIKVTWKKITGAQGYYVYRKVKGGSYKKIATIKKASTISYTDKTIKKGKTYTYYVRAYKGSALSGYSTKTK